MGCVCKPTQVKITRNKICEMDKDSTGITTKTYVDRISRNSWANIINFLNHKEVKEVGKVNK
jgi:hypothetical protein